MDFGSIISAVGSAIGSIAGGAASIANAVQNGNSQAYQVAQYSAPPMVQASTYGAASGDNTMLFVVGGIALLVLLAGRK